MVEEDATKTPKGEKQLRWLLLTTLPVETDEQAMEVIRIYGQRWQAELVFATLKSDGIDLESTQLESGWALKNMAVMCFAAALRVNMLRTYREDANNVSATLIFSKKEIGFLALVVANCEGKTEKQKNGYPPGTMAWAAWAIARLGGWKGYASESPPGNKTMKEGLKTFIMMFQGFSMLKL